MARCWSQDYIDKVENCIESVIEKINSIHDGTYLNKKKSTTKNEKLFLLTDKLLKSGKKYISVAFDELKTL